MKTLYLWFAVVAWEASLSAAEPSQRFTREIKSPPLQQEELLGVVLDTDVYAHTRDGLPDVRILDEAGNSARYVLRKVQATQARTVRRSWSPRQLDAKPLPDDGLEITVELSKEDLQPQGLRLVTNLRDFEQRVRVYASDDGQNWEPASAETLVFDYSRYVDVRNDAVPLADSVKRRFRIVVDKVTVEQESELLALTRRLQGAEETERSEKIILDRRPFRIERLEFWRDVQYERIAGDEKTAYPTTGLRVEQDAGRKQTIVLVDIQRQPVTSLRLETADRNFSRRVVVQGKRPAGGDVWQPLADAVVSRVDFKSLQRDETAVAIPESRQLQYRLVVDNRDSNPLQIASVSAEGNVYELVCLAAPGKRYELAYGAGYETAPAYDTAALNELLNAGFTPTRAELGPPQPDVRPVEAQAFHWSQLLNNGAFLGSVIALLLVGLGWGLFQATKRINQLPS